MDRSGETALKERLLRQAALLTPNIYEAAALLGVDAAQSEDEMKRQAERLLRLGPAAVLLKGGHSAGPLATDLFFEGKEFRFHSSSRIATRNTHGTGCTLASAIAAFLVRGFILEEAVSQAKQYVHGAIEHGRDLNIGDGFGPISHFYRQVN